MKFKSLLLLIFFMPVFLFSQEEMGVEINGNTVYFFHNNTERNCASFYEFQLIKEGNELTLFEIDTDELCAYCLCDFDLNTEISDLNSGFYNLNIYSTENCLPQIDTIFWGTIVFEIEEGYNGFNPMIQNSFSSDCLNLCPPPDPFEVIIDCYDWIDINLNPNEKYDILGYNLYLNGVYYFFFDGSGYLMDPFELSPNEIYTFCITTVCDIGESEPSCLEIRLPDYLPPINLSADVSGFNPIISWDPPEVDPELIIGYTIYRDGFPVSGSAPWQDTQWVDENVSINENYEYAISTIYKYCASELSESIRVDIVSKLKEEKELTFNISPIPFEDEIQIQHLRNIHHIYIYDMIGNIVYKETGIYKQNIIIQPTNLKEGIYFIEVRTSQDDLLQKIIKR